MSQSNQWTYLLNMFSYLPKAGNGTFAGLRNGRTVLIPWIAIGAGLSHTYASCCSGVGHCIVGPDQAVVAAPLYVAGNWSISRSVGDEELAMPCWK